jgi:hypothetical protein
MAKPTMTPAASTTVRARAVLVIAASALALVAGLLVMPRANATPESTAAPMATSTTCDNGYGCPTSSTQGAITPVCSLSTTSATPGTKITATITNVPPGSQISLLFDGNQVGSKTADANGGAVMSFTVPANASQGQGHTVVFSGAGFSCDATGGAGFEVLAEAVTRGGGGGSLSNTGIEVALYLAVALVLLVAGWQLVRMAKARRRRIARQQGPAHRHVARR